MSELNRNLGGLADPKLFTTPLNIRGRDVVRLRNQLRTMLLIRRAEEKIGAMVEAGKIVCPCHLGIGQEAIAVGVSRHLRGTDRIFGAHRSHPHFLALGSSVYSLLAEVLGKQEGCSHGMGGSMHLYDASHGFIGSVPIVAGTVPLAVGAAMAAKKSGKGDVAVAYFGDGAAEEGIIHESLNLAAAFKLPILFVCENNLFSSHLHISLRQPADRVARFGDAHCMPTATIDGNDVTAVEDAAGEFITAMRDGAGPAFLEAVTYRWRGHVGPREDNDVGVNRGKDLVLWKERDPIERLASALSSSGALSEREYSELNEGVIAEIEEAWSRAESAPYPPDSALLDRVYSRNQA